MPCGGLVGAAAERQDMEHVTHDPAWTSEFERLGRMPDSEIDLAVAALLIAQAEYPDLEGEAELEALDDMAKVVRPRLEAEVNADPLGQLDTLRRWLADDLGFNGSHDNYYDPRNSYINDVLDRRVGIPISLSLIYVEVGRRAGLPMVGIGMPGHFLVGHEDVVDAFLDPFHGGSLLSRREAMDLFERMMAGAPGGVSIPWSDAYLTPISSRGFVTRMLRNLKGIHLRFQDYERAVRVLDMLVAIHPTEPMERRDRGLAHYRQGNRAQALADLRLFADSCPPGQGDPTIEEILQRLGR